MALIENDLDINQIKNDIDNDIGNDIDNDIGNDDAIQKYKDNEILIKETEKSINDINVLIAELNKLKREEIQAIQSEYSTQQHLQLQQQSRVLSNNKYSDLIRIDVYLLLLSLLVIASLIIYIGYINYIMSY